MNKFEFVMLILAVFAIFMTLPYAGRSVVKLLEHFDYALVRQLSRRF